MTVEWICTRCGKSWQHPTFCIQHIAQEHYGGEIMFNEVAQWILVSARPVEEE